MSCSILGVSEFSAAGGVLGSKATGYMENIRVDTTVRSIPAIGSLTSGGTWPYSSGAFSLSVAVLLGDPWSGSSTLTVTFNNQTQAKTVSVTFTSGTQYNTNALASSSINNGDIVTVDLSVSSGSVVIPFLEWGLNVGLN
jgi:hypothetical protein